MSNRTEVITLDIARTIGVKPPVGYHDQYNLYMDGKHKVVLEGPYEVAVYLSMSAGLPAPFSRKTGSKESELVLHFATPVDAENFVVAMRINIAGKSANNTE